MFPYGHNGAFVSLPLRNSYLFGSISYSTFLILFNSGFIVPCFGLALPLTGNVLLKCGLLHLKFLLKTARSKKCFPLTKLIKKWRRKHFLRLNFTKFSTQEPSIPHFSNTMLCDVAIFHNFLFS